MRVTLVLIVVVAILSFGTWAWRARGPQIDASRVVTFDDLLPMALNCLTYRAADHRGWPSGSPERAYVRFLQDNGVHVAFQPDEAGKHFVLVGFADALKVRTLYQKAKAAGIVVPESPFTSGIEPE